MIHAIGRDIVQEYKIVRLASMLVGELMLFKPAEFVR